MSEQELTEAALAENIFRLTHWNWLKPKPEKKDPLRGSFFSYRPSAGTAPSAPPPPPNWIALAPRPVSHARLDRRCTYPCIALSYNHLTVNMVSLPVGERWVNPLPDEASSTKWEKSLSQATVWAMIWCIAQM